MYKRRMQHVNEHGGEVDTSEAPCIATRGCSVVRGTDNGRYKLSSPTMLYGENLAGFRKQTDILLYNMLLYERFEYCEDGFYRLLEDSKHAYIHHRHRRLRSHVVVVC